MRQDLHHRWLKTKRPLRSLGTSRRALRDAARATVASVALRDCLCRPSCQLAA